MKKLLLTLFIFVALIAAIPLSILALAYDGSAESEIPVDLYAQNISGKDRLLMDLEAAFDEARNDDEADLVLPLSQDVINLLIYDWIIGDDDEEGMNPSYAPGENCQASQCYILEELIDANGTPITARLLGLWAEFDEGLLIFNAAIEAQYGDGFTFKSRVAIQFTLEDDTETDTITVAFDRVRLGSIPLTRTLFSWVMGVLPISDFESDALGIGTLSMRNLSYQVNKAELVELLSTDENDEEDLTMMLISTIFEQNLLTIGIEESQFVINLRMSVIRNRNASLPQELLELQDAEGNFDTTLFDAERHLQTRFENFVFNMALTGNTNLTISQRTFNKILYQSMEGFEGLGFSYEYQDTQGNPKTLDINFLGLWFDFDVDESNQVILYIRGLFDFAGIVSLMEIRADEVSSTGGVYIFEFSEMTLGKEEDKEYLTITNMTPFTNFLKDMGEFPFGEINDAGNLIIDTTVLTDLIDDGAQEGSVEVGQIMIVKGGIRLSIEATDPALQDILNDFTQALETVFTDPAINTALQNSLDTENDGPEKETYTKFTQLQDKINNPDPNDPVTEDDISDLFESYEQMDPAAQEAFMDAFESAVDPAIFSQFQSNFQD